jgi:predicted nucleic acid-binding protein
MTPTDTGPLVALLDSRDKHHVSCVAASKRLPRPFLTTWPCLTEAMHLLGRALGHAAQDALWAMVVGGIVRLPSLSESDYVRMRLLMDKYSDTPMDLADASLVVMCETLNASRIFTVDSDFYFYVLANGRPLAVIP